MFHLAQINIARTRHPLDDPRMAGFTGRLGEINALAEASPGFVWRLQEEAGDATLIRLFEDPAIIVNMSVWTGVEALADFTYRTAHAGVFRGRAGWFERLSSPHLALWWIAAGETPTPEEGRSRLELLGRSGPTPAAFTLGRRFAPPEPACGPPALG